nr:UDP-N-acetylglucosamine--N-acetylmuramyl-(pentapeptide) pyrophosphoryl-undecaprenol N-acetylglucosamine transferase [Muribaculaceae bacterium]
PVRSALLEQNITPAEARKKLGFDPERPLILVVGGSLGARTINNSMADALPRFVENNIQLLWQTGKAYENKIPAALENMPDSIKATPFIDDMGLAYRAADLVVARAGAGTISELQLLGKPALLVPSPNVAEDHQRKNAQALVNHQAAEMVLDADAAATLADNAIRLVGDRHRLTQLSEGISAMAMHDSDDRIVDEIVKTMNKHHHSH